MDADDMAAQCTPSEAGAREEEEEESPTVGRKAESGRRRRAAESESAPSVSLSDGRLENLHGADGKSLIQVCAV